MPAQEITMGNTTFPYTFPVVFGAVVTNIKVMGHANQTIKHRKPLVSFTQPWKHNAVKSSAK